MRYLNHSPLGWMVFYLSVLLDRICEIGYVYYARSDYATLDMQDRICKIGYVRSDMVKSDMHDGICMTKCVVPDMCGRI